jgi:hypothetical protein
LLWQRGELEGALRLEELWNGQLNLHDARIVCAYKADKADARMQAVAALHGRVV